MIHGIIKQKRDQNKGVCFRTHICFSPTQNNKNGVKDAKQKKKKRCYCPIYLLLTSLLGVLLLLTQTLHGLVAAEAGLVASLLGHFFGVSNVLGRLLDTLFFKSLLLEKKEKKECVCERVCVWYHC